MLRVSTTWIEQFRRFLVYDYVEEPAMIARIRGIPIEDKWQMQAGNAWHSVLENYDRIVTTEQHALLLNVDPAAEGEEDSPLFNPEGGVNHANYIRCGKYLFNRHHVAAARQKIGHCLWEVKGNRIFETRFGPCNLIAKADNVWGLRVQDTKAKFNGLPTGTDWESDLQWRIYLLVHGAELFRYNAFSFLEPEEMHDTPGVFNMEMRDYISFNFWRYADMEKDVLVWLGDFLEWADSKNLLPHMHKEPRD